MVNTLLMFWFGSGQLQQSAALVRVHLPRVTCDLSVVVKPVMHNAHTRILYCTHDRRRWLSLRALLYVVNCVLLSVLVLLFCFTAITWVQGSWLSLRALLYVVNCVLLSVLFYSLFYCKQVQGSWLSLSALPYVARMAGAAAGGALTDRLIGQWGCTTTESRSRLVGKSHFHIMHV